MFEVLREEMQKRQLSQRRLADMASMAGPDLNQAMKGRRPMYPAWRCRIAKVLNMTEDKLFPEFSEAENKAE